MFESFNKFELEDVSQMNEYDRHLEHSEIYEHTLHKKKDASEWSLEEYFENVQVTENLHIAISKLPEVQKRRLNKYYFEEKTFDKIALEEGCTYQCVQRSVYRAVAKDTFLLLFGTDEPHERTYFIYLQVSDIERQIQ